MKANGGENIDETAAGLIRSSRIRIDEAELLDFTPGNDEDESKTAYGHAHDGQMQPETEHSGYHSSTSVEDPGAMASRPENGRQPKINVTDNSALGLPHATVRIACSKGTYVRAFARDLGEALGSGAHLDSLIRSRSGDFRIENALKMENVLDILNS